MQIHRDKVSGIWILPYGMKNPPAARDIEADETKNPGANETEKPMAGGVQERKAKGIHPRVGKLFQAGRYGKQAGTDRQLDAQANPCNLSETLEETKDQI